MKHQLVYFLSLLLVMAGCGQKKNTFEATLPSPDFDIHLYFTLFKGHPYYMVYQGKEKVLGWSALGFNAANVKEPGGDLVLAGEFGAADAGSGQQLKEGAFFSDLKYNSLSVHLRSHNSPDMAYAIDFRAFNAGIAYRYRFETREALKQLAGLEVSELSFDQALGAWTVENQPDTLGQGLKSVLSVPAILSFAGTKEVTIMEEGGTGGSGVNLSVDPSNNHLFRVEPNPPDTERKNSSSPAATPWRILVINKNQQE